MHLHKVEPNVNERVWFISYSLLELFKKLMKFTILQYIFLKKEKYYIYVPIYSMYSKLRLKFTLASRFMRKKYKRMLKVHFEIKLK